ncbi:MAG: hypothetical protein H7Y04_16485 [Verrucomicrobia bacterium]|nr:hypothetical protein [Cytophagales bacterium]
MEAVVVKKIPFNEAALQEIRTEDVQFQVGEVFKGNPFLSVPGISILVMSVFLATIPSLNSTQTTVGALIIAVVFILSFILFSSWLMFFFEVSQDFLTVRNHCLFWIKHYYKLENIREVLIDQHGKSYNFLKIITKDFRIHTYQAATLKDAIWLDLIANLKNKGIKVRNECIGK